MMSKRGICGTTVSSVSWWRKLFFKLAQPELLLLSLGQIKQKLDSGLLLINTSILQLIIAVPSSITPSGFKTKAVVAASHI